MSFTSIFTIVLVGLGMAAYVYSARTKRKLVRKRLRRLAIGLVGSASIIAAVFLISEALPFLVSAVAIAWLAKQLMYKESSPVVVFVLKKFG